MTNLLFIYADDLFAYRKFRNTFGQTIQTPNLDRLEQTATVLNNAYAMTPSCGPSRASTMTGWSPWESAVHGNANTGNEWYDRIPTRDNLSAHLKSSGFHVEWAGKVMHGYGTQPVEQQRMLHHAVMENGPFTPDTNATDGSVTKFWPVGNFDVTGVEGKDDQFYDNRVANYAVAMIQRMTARPAGSPPWAMFAGFQHPHTGYAAPTFEYLKYTAAGITEPTTWSEGDLPRATVFAAQFMNDGAIWPSRDMENWRQHVRAYLACISHLDTQAGRVIDALEASPFADDTAIVFLSDHGYHAGDHDTWGKFTLWEEAALTPLIVKMPGQTVGSVSQTPVGLMDVYPTVLDLLGLPPLARLAGQSVRPLMPGQSGTYENRGATTNVLGSVGIRWGEYRYILYPNGEQELYNVVSDPSQRFNLVATMPTVVTECRMQLVLENARYGLFHATGDLPSVREARKFALYNGARVRGGKNNDTFFIGGDIDAEIESDGGRNEVWLGHWTESNPYTLPEATQDLFVGVKRAISRPTIRLNDQDNKADSPQSDWVGYGGGGNDTMTGPAASILHGEDGDDVLTITGPGGEAYGGAGNDTITITGGLARGGDGNDTIRLVAAGTAYGDAGDDSITGSTGADTLHGGTGNDTINGGAGNDLIYGGPGRNRLDGGAGDDTIHADGQDTVTGGSGSDTFVIGRAAEVWITDWQVGETIDLSAWMDEPDYRQINTNQVLIHSGARSVLVTCAAQITPATVQQSVVIA